MDRWQPALGRPLPSSPLEDETFVSVGAEHCCCPLARQTKGRRSLPTISDRLRFKGAVRLNCPLRSRGVKPAVRL